MRERAERAPEIEVRGTIGAEHEVGVMSIAVEMVGRELYLGFSAREVTYDRFIPVLAAFAPDAQWRDWQQVGTFGRRPLAEGELCMRVALYDE